jgi:hypothetical protein
MWDKSFNCRVRRKGDTKAISVCGVCYIIVNKITIREIKHKYI